MFRYTSRRFFLNNGKQNLLDSMGHDGYGLGNGGSTMGENRMDFVLPDRPPKGQPNLLGSYNTAGLGNSPLPLRGNRRHKRSVQMTDSVMLIFLLIVIVAGIWSN